MFREESVEELSDGKLYTANDLVKIGTDDCRGCSDCCRMGPVIVLDPLDVLELNRFLQQSFEELLNETIELKVIDGLILPVLKLIEEDRYRNRQAESSAQQEPQEESRQAVSSEKQEPQEESRRAESPAKQETREAMVCPYLGEDGRCTIHDFRPGICRLYPLGRSWENDDFHYILQVNECTHCSGTKVKVKKWLGIPNLSAYEDYCRDWHSLLTRIRRLLEGTDPENRLRNQVCVYLLKQFFLCDWNVDDFYAVFDERRLQALHHLGFAL